MCFFGLTAKNSFVNRRDMSQMTLISMPTLHLTQISKFEPFPWNFQNTMIGFHLRKMYKFIYKQISPKCDYLGYFSLRTWLYFSVRTHWSKGRTLLVGSWHLVVVVVAQSLPKDWTESSVHSGFDSLWFYPMRLLIDRIYSYIRCKAVLNK